jgi:Flp pilus assembly CpaE family ATPase
MAVDGPESEAGLAALRSADMVLVVVRGDVPAVKRARRLISGLTAAGLRSEALRVVLNRDGQAGQLSLSQIESAVGRPVQHRIPEDPGRVNRAMNFGQLAVENRGSRLARAFYKMAAELAGGPTEQKWWPFS